MNYTKGEWKANSTAIDCDGWPIAQTYPDTRLDSITSLKLMRANAHLIAAAPMMYEALKALEKWYHSKAGELPYYARQALAKAEGKETQ